MPPPFPQSRGMGQSRMTANPARPVKRYRPGKAVAEEHSDSDEDEEVEEQTQPEPPRPQAKSFPAGRVGATKPRPAPVEEDSDEEGFVTEEEEDEDGGVNVKAPGKPVEASAPARAIPGSLAKQPKVEQGEDEDEEEEEEEDDESEEESSEEESSEEEAPQRKLLRPTFIKKADRNGKTASPVPVNGKAASSTPQPTTTSSTAPEAVDSTTNADGLTEEEARRRELADMMIQDKLEKDAIARAAGKKSWDDDEEVAPEDVVDDTDGIDPEAEMAAWKLRELKRLKRDREAIEAREKEIEEVERRRNLTAEEREKEDAEYIAAQKEEQSGKGKAGFMQRYHHKGAFFQDDEVAQEVLARRDLMGAKYADEVKNRDALPEYMQIRDMTKLGRKGRTRYKDLKSEDTGKWGDFGRGPRKDRGFGSNVDDERFRPDDDRRNGSQGPTGANAGALGSRKRVDGAPEGPRSMRDGGNGRNDTYRPSRRRSDDEDEERDRPRRRRSYSRSRSRSRSPRRRHRYDRSDEEDGHSSSRRKRSTSPYRDRDKRRRVDVV